MQRRNALNLAAGAATVTAGAVGLFFFVRNLLRSGGAVLHVLPDGERWKLVAEDHQEPIAVFDTKKEALDEGRRLASEADERSELVIHGSDGKIQRRHSYDDAAVN